MANGRVSTTYKDGDGYSSTTDIYFNIPTTATVAQVQAELGSLAAKLNAVTGATITDMRLHLEVDISGLTPNTPAVGLSNNNALVLSIPVPASGRSGDVVVPALAPGNITSGGPNMAEGGAIDLLADQLEVAMAGTGVTSGFYTNNAYQEFGPTASGFLGKRKLVRHISSRSRRVGA